MVASVGSPHRVAVDVNGSLLPSRSRNFDDKHVLTLDIFDAHVFVGEHAGTQLIRTVSGVPKVIGHPMSVLESDGFECIVFALGNAKQNDSTVGIGKRGDARPDALRQASLCRLRLETVILFVAVEFAQVHVRPFLYLSILPAIHTSFQLVPH